MKSRMAVDPSTFARQTKKELRESFHVDSLFESGELELVYTNTDRAIVGSAVPLSESLSLPQSNALGTSYFTERRELGVINIGGAGTVEIDGEVFDLDLRDSLYIGSGNRSVSFSSIDASDPAKYYFVSYPAHASLPCRKIVQGEANKIELGDDKSANKRVIYQSIAPGVVETCQVIMGFTELLEGNVWNTFPPHTHARRSEIYMYFDLDENDRVFHFMGTPEENKNIILKSGEAVVSPSWSMHTGVGTSAYTFIWEMGCENHIFDDMDHIDVSKLL